MEPGTVVVDRRELSRLEVFLCLFEREDGGTGLEMEDSNLGP